jgi:dolichyl-phosphate beta-glucosyltransferase
MMKNTAIVIPCYNESERLEVKAFTDYAARDPNVVILFVNDGSTDGTQELLERLADLDPDTFRVIALGRNSGKAEAIRQGILSVLDLQPVFVGYWDADLATPLEAILEFRDVLESNPSLEVVLGSRVCLLGREVSRSPRRHYLGRIFASLSSLTLGLAVYDTQCGAKLFRVSPATRALFHDPFSTRWIFDVEILARLIRARHLARQPQAGSVLFEFPLHRWHDVAGSKLRVIDFLRAPLELLTIYRLYLADIRADVRTTSSHAGPHFSMKPVAHSSPRRAGGHGR